MSNSVESSIGDLTTGSIFPSPSISTSGTLFYSDTRLSKIESLLERIAESLERMAPPKDERPLCAFCNCRCEDDCYDHIGYGTQWDGECICCDCLQRALEGLSK